MNTQHGLSERPRSLADQLVVILTDDLRYRRLRPGMPLREAELCSRFNVSRPAVREALNRLETLGLVENIPRKGARVVDYSPEELDDLIGFHAVVFSHICKLAAERRSESELATIKAACRQLERLVDGEASVEEYEAARVQCYIALQRAIGPAHQLNRRRAFLMRIWNPYSIDAVATPELRRASAQRWARLAELVEAGDGEGAAKQFRDMAATTRSTILEACRAWRAQRPPSMVLEA